MKNVRVSDMIAEEISIRNVFLILLLNSFIKKILWIEDSDKFLMIHELQKTWILLKKEVGLGSFRWEYWKK